MDKLTLIKLEKDLELTLSANPGLTVKYNKNIPAFLEGWYQVVDDKNVVQEEYDISVRIPTTYPYGFPTLREISNKIPRIEDRHIDANGNACVELTHKTILASRAGLTIYDYFKRYVHRYFCWQIVFEVDGGSENLDEWAHGKEAIEEFYQQVLSTNDRDSIKSLLQLASEGKMPSLNRDCPCNSGKLFKRCHAIQYQILLALGKRRIIQDIKIFEK